MRVAFEKWGRPPYPKEFDEAIKNCRRIHSHIMSIEQYLKYQEYDVKSL